QGVGRCGRRATWRFHGRAGGSGDAAASPTRRASDLVGVTGYYVASSATPPLATAAGWVAVPATLSYTGSVGTTLSGGDGTKTVYAWYKDAAGNVSGTALDTIDRKSVV